MQKPFPENYDNRSMEHGISTSAQVMETRRSGKMNSADSKTKFIASSFQK
jgi:hypothetical protein